MALLNRLIGAEMTPDEDALGKLPVHQCIAAWGEYSRGRQPFATWTELVARFGLSTSEETELQGWVAAVGAGAFTLQELEQVLELAEAGYLTLAETKARLGLAP